jgi:hypothetical protein
MVITGYLFVIYLKKRYFDSGINITYIKINNILNGFRLVF